jgi:nitrilase
LRGSEGLLVAEVDLADIVRARFDFDAAGHYARPDIFRLDVTPTAR